MSETNSKSSWLDDRGLLAVSGGEAESFLQNLITNDIQLLAEKSAVYAALLSPQGKYLFDFFIVKAPDGGFFLDCEAERLADLVKRLSMYKLRADVILEDRSDDFRIMAIWDTAPTEVEGILYQDPRSKSAGWRLISSSKVQGRGDDYEAHRIALGLSNGSKDIQVDRNFFMEANGDLHAGVAFDKGCFVGQETTARMKHRNLVRKRLLPVTFEDQAPKPGSSLEVDGKTVGEIRSAHGRQALALLPLATAGPGVELNAGAKTGQVGTPVGWQEIT